MKVFIHFILTYVFLQVKFKQYSANPVNHQIQDVTKSCLSELNLDGKKISDLSGDLNAPEDNVDFGNFLECVWTKTGVTNGDGNVNESGLKLYLKTDLFAGPETETGKKTQEAIMEGCKDVQGNTKGIIAVKLNKCVWNYITKYYNT